jgi:hypothetical protein
MERLAEANTHGPGNWVAIAISIFLNANRSATPASVKFLPASDAKFYRGVVGFIYSVCCRRKLHTQRTVVGFPAMRLGKQKVAGRIRLVLPRDFADGQAREFSNGQHRSRCRGSARKQKNG